MDASSPLDPQVQHLLQSLNASGVPDFSTLSPQQARALPLGAPNPEPVAVGRVESRALSIENRRVPVRVYRPEAPSGAGLVYFHGGGWVVGDLDSDDDLCRRLCVGAEVTVVSVDYRLAPESPFPGALEDAFGVTRLVADRGGSFGIDPSRLAVGGQSAGGNLAAVVALEARDRGGPRIAFQLLIYPIVDANFGTRSYEEYGEGFLLTKRAMEWFWDHYVPERSQRDQARVAPLRAGELGGLPPALVQTAQFDPLRDEGRAYAERLRAAGNEVSHHEYLGVIHGFMAMPPIDAAGRAMSDAVRSLRHYLGVGAPPR